MLATLKLIPPCLDSSKGVLTMETSAPVFNFLIVLLAHPTVLEFISDLQRSLSTEAWSS